MKNFLYLNQTNYTLAGYNLSDHGNLILTNLIKIKLISF